MANACSGYQPGADMLDDAIKNNQISIAGPDAARTYQRFAKALSDPDFARDVQSMLDSGKRIELNTHEGSNGRGPFSSHAEVGGSRANLYTGDYARADPTRVLIHEVYHLSGLQHGPALEAKIGAARDGVRSA
ncbi:MAG TPA: hypothetical protein VEA41_06000 [Salinarimonas sp.]|nr:hypothetical protein [Salinarimonas sp.]